MTFKQLAKELSKREGLKKQINIERERSWIFDGFYSSYRAPTPRELPANKKGE